jgi:hypothetical protein
MKPHLSRHQFAALDHSVQAALVNYEGVDLGLCFYNGSHCVLLYSLFDFYVEIWQTRRTKQLKKIASFTSYKRLDHFLSSLDISFVNVLLRA